MEVKIALLGGGNVGQGFLSVLRNKREQIFSRYGISFQLVAVCGLSAGSILSANGLRIREILPLLEDGTGLIDYQPAEIPCVKGLDANATIELSHADVIIECTYSDYETGEPATGYVRKALGMRKHVVSTNKGPVSLHYKEIKELAHANGVKFLFGGTVMSGMPVVSLFANAFRADDVLEVRAALNVSTNFILGAMEQGISPEEALKEASQRGYLESNPENDLNGYDPMAKLLILINMLTGCTLLPEQVVREGITNISTRDVQAAMERQLRYRMISKAWREPDGSWRGHVGPCKIGPKDPFYSIGESWNAIQVKTELMGEMFMAGPGTGKMETGYAMLSDLLSIYVS